MARDTVGSRLSDALASLDIIDESSFALALKRPFPLMTYALGSAVGAIPAIMREEDALSDPGRLVTTTIGSGPFRFVREDWMAGQRVVYARNPDYRPRREPADGLAGGRVVKVDRVEWRNIPDASTVAAALQSGEIDIWEQVAGDLVPIISRQRGTVVDRLNALGTQSMLRPNSLFPPFNDPRACLALAYIVDQADTMAAGFGDPRCGDAATLSSSAAPAMLPRPGPRPMRGPISSAPARSSPRQAIAASGLSSSPPTTSPGSAAWPRWRRPACARRG